ncbi:hypothetical protein [Paraburkholderia sp.]|jgi:hypothetical protein|uniref:hypothetical protein n=1 Tax=Paraburkholderia sp. TaxID=1926495 RepID=UPI002F40EDA0
MNAVSPSLTASGSSAGFGTRLIRLLFFCTVALAGTLFWIAPRPPLADLPQHAAQVALLHDLLTGTSPWSDLVRVNYFTPYLLGYGLALALSFVMPVLAALKLCMMLAFYAFVAAGLALRKEFRADARLDWLYVLGFFGYAYQYGFYTFLLAVPVGLFFLILARRFAQAPTRAGGLAVLVAGVFLFFSHGLMFLFCCALGAAFIPCFVKGFARMLRAALPYALLGVLTLTYLAYVKHSALVIPAGSTQASAGTMWDWSGSFGWHRVYNFLLYTVATEMKDWYFMLGAMFMLAAPWLMGAKLNRQDPSALLPMLGAVLIWFAAPSDAMGIAALYQRFAIILLTAYALMFRAEAVHAKEINESAPRRTGATPRTLLTQVLLMIFCWSYLSVLAVREHRVAVEDAPFETLLDATEPGQRALSLIYAPESPIIDSLWTYHTYPLWYQADRQGFVDFNFAFFLPQIVRFRPDRIPPARPSAEGSAPQDFSWHKFEGRMYRYFFVRHTAPLPPQMFANDECQVVLIKQVPDWSLFERRACR